MTYKLFLRHKLRHSFKVLEHDLYNGVDKTRHETEISKGVVIIYKEIDLAHQVPVFMPTINALKPISL